MKSLTLDGISLCVLVPDSDNAVAFERLVTCLCGAGVRMLQIRAKDLDDDELAARVRMAMAIARSAAPARPPLVLVNDRVHVAAQAGADGVHVGAGDMPVAEARRVLGSDAIIGRTAHSIDEARQAVADGADYLGVGPCFPSTTKSFASYASRAFLAEAAKLPLPVFAIGGITVDRAVELRSLGIERVAVAAAITSAADPAAAARNLVDALAR
jgi:thiamine-phosphate pyrophosphorylase